MLLRKTLHLSVSVLPSLMTEAYTGPRVYFRVPEVTYIDQLSYSEVCPIERDLNLPPNELYQGQCHPRRDKCPARASYLSQLCLWPTLAPLTPKPFSRFGVDLPLLY